MSQQTPSVASVVGGGINIEFIDEGPRGGESSGSGRSSGDGPGGSKGLFQIPQDSKLFLAFRRKFRLCYCRGRSYALWDVVVCARCIIDATWTPGT